MTTLSLSDMTKIAERVRPGTYVPKGPITGGYGVYAHLLYYAVDMAKVLNRIRHAEPYYVVAELREWADELAAQIEKEFVA